MIEPPPDPDRPTPATDEETRPATLPMPCPGGTPTVAQPIASESDLPAVSPSSVEPAGQPFGRYRLLQKLGQGGMGVVWKAYDVQLKRVVALKQILGGAEDPAMAERFLREAQAAARLRHPNIIGVYEAGVVDGRHYLTTEYIEGQSLRDVMSAETLPPRKSAELVRQVADALSYAHAQGIVHRDLKPENILVDSRAKPYVMDFGLAKDVREELGRNLTLSGQVLGTVGYMSPEQASGYTVALGPPTDQFALGVLLYELLTGVLPFACKSYPEFLDSVRREEPAPPSRVNPRVQRDLETICLKALEKDPLLRYGSLSELAEDLGRWLEGEPIAARPVGRFAGLRRKAIRHWRVVLPTTAAIAVAIAFGVYAVVIHVRNIQDLDAERSRTARTLQKAERVSQVLRRWGEMSKTGLELEDLLWSRPPSLEAHRKRGDALWGPVREFMDAFPEGDEGHCTMLAFAGWARRLAGYEEEGEAWMREARERDKEVPYGALALGMTRFALYVDQQPLPPMATTKAGVEFGPAPAETGPQARLRGEMIELFTEADHAPIWGKGEGDVCRNALSALRAMQEGDYAKAEEGLTGAIGTLQLRSMRTSLVLARAKVRFIRKEFPGAIEDIEDVLACRGAMREAWYYSGLIRDAHGVDQAARGEDPRPSYERAIGDFGQALQRNQDYTLAYGDRGVAQLLLGQAESARELDPRESYRKAIADLGEALRRNPEDGATYFNRASGYMALGEAEEARGLDPRMSYQAAAADFDSTLACNPDIVQAYRNCGFAYKHLGDSEQKRGVDPRGHYERAITRFGQALLRDPSSAWTYNDRATTLVGLGDAEEARGVDSLGTYKKAITDLGEALARRSDFPEAYNNRGLAYTRLGEAERARGMDPMTSYREAIADFGRALDREPDYAPALSNRGLAYADLAEAEQGQGADPMPNCRNAIADYDAALKHSPSLWQAHMCKGLLLEKLGDPAKAVDCYEKALAIVGDSQPTLEQWLARARAAAEAKPALPSWAQEMVAADQAIQAGDYASARPHYEAVLARAPAQPDAAAKSLLHTAHYNLACLYALLSVGKTGPKADAQAVPADEAARCQERAFRHLRQAIEIGTPDTKHLFEDADMVPLHDDPRWRELTDPLRAK